MMIKGSVFQEDLTVQNVCEPRIINIKIIIKKKHENNSNINQETHRTERRNRQIHIYSSRFQHLLSAIYKSNRQKISEHIVDMKNNINQLNLIDIYRLLCLREQNHTLSKFTWNIYQVNG